MPCGNNVFRDAVVKVAKRAMKHCSIFKAELLARKSVPVYIFQYTAILVSHTSSICSCASLTILQLVYCIKNPKREEHFSEVYYNSTVEMQAVSEAIAVMEDKGDLDYISRELFLEVVK